MSGGSMDYVCYHVMDASRMCEDAEISDLLKDLSDVLHDEEWWKSCDTSESDYRETLNKFKAKWLRNADPVDRLRSYIDGKIEECRKRCYGLVGISPDGCAAEKDRAE